MTTSLMQCAARSAPQPSAASPARAREHQLRADTVRRRGEQAPLVERIEAGEGAEAGRAGRLHRRAQPLDDALGGRQRHAGCLVRLAPRSRTESSSARRTARRGARASRPARRRRSGRACPRPTTRSVVDGKVEDLGQRARLLVRVVGLQLQLGEREEASSRRAARRSSRAADGSRRGSRRRSR